VELKQRAAMSDADDYRVPGRVAQQRVQEGDRRLGQQNPRESQPLLLATRQPLRPEVQPCA
jgi:hypothetical protein